MTAESSSLVLLYAAMYGLHYDNIKRELYDDHELINTDSWTRFADLAIDYAKHAQQSWLDMTTHTLDTWRDESLSLGVLPPTIVLVGDGIDDLCLFWNLRAGSDPQSPPWYLPLPVKETFDSKIVGRLKEWMLSFRRYNQSADYCFVTSQTVAEDVCRRFARELQVELADTPIKAVDFYPVPNRVSVVVPFEREAVWPVDIIGRRLTIQPPSPQAVSQIGSSTGWFVDLVRDGKTRRAVKELQLPPTPVALELLNGPCPPKFEMQIVPRVGDGVDSINIHCTSSEALISIHLPTGTEILEEILHEHGFTPVVDEKRGSYLPAIRLFGGLHDAADALTGVSGSIFRELGRKPLTVNEIKGRCKLGSSPLPGESYADKVRPVFETMGGRLQRIGPKRFARYARYQTPDNLSLTSVLEYWADRSVLLRRWKIGPCGRCKQISFVSTMDIQRPIACPRCANRVALRRFVELGYSTNETIGLAIEEGITPVVQTGRFLRRMTSHGFLWVPGVKYEQDGQTGDIDLIACCDGYLVFAECKQLASTPEDARCWEQVVSQLIETARVASCCGGALVVLAALVDKFPAHVVSEIADKIQMPSLLLTRLDLERGQRDIQAGGVTRQMQFVDILRPRFPEQPLDQTVLKRTIKTGWGLYTREAAQ